MQRAVEQDQRHAGDRAPRRAPRSGAALVEFAVVAPVFFLLIFGLLEFGRMVMCYQVMTNAVREGARVATVPGTTSTDVTSQVNAALANGFVNGATVTVTPSNLPALNQGDVVTIEAEVPFESVSWLPMPQWLGGKTLRTEASMTREGK